MSYYVFRLISVAIDSYRTSEAPTSARNFFSYVFLFTIFVAGPIERYGAFAEQKVSQFESAYLTEGAMRLAAGLVKLTLLIDAIVYVRDGALRWETGVNVAAQLPSLGCGELWLALLAAYLTGYLNLSSYTDIAIGSSRLFGFRIMENFSYPIVARSLDDFWRRWHISLTSWCQTYVYSVVLGALRNPYIAVVAAFQVMGLWHVITPNRVAWGLFQAGGIIALFVARRVLGRRRQKTGYAAFLAALSGWFATQAFVVASFVFVVNEQSNDVMSSLRLIPRLAGI
jgi:alginate O-acetyltransferase complex protein AlgI